MEFHPMVGKRARHSLQFSSPVSGGHRRLPDNFSNEKRFRETDDENDHVYPCFRVSVLPRQRARSLVTVDTSAAWT